MEKKDLLEKVTTTLISLDGHVFQLEEAVFVELQAIHRRVSAGGDAAISIPQITGDILAKIVDYCTKHIDHKLNRLSDEEISAWDRVFLDVDESILFDLLVGSHFLGVRDLFNLIVTSVADMTKKNSPGQPGNIDQLHNIFLYNFRL